ncbi:MAG: hypothetical protein AB8F78_15435 [Saprospiraceae bacterium]
MIETLVEIEHIEDFPEQGFYSRSFKGNDARLQRIVAVKDIHASNVESKEAVEKYFEEAQKLSLAAPPPPSPSCLLCWLRQNRSKQWPNWHTSNCYKIYRNGITKSTA